MKNVHRVYLYFNSDLIIVHEYKYLCNSFVVLIEFGAHSLSTLHDLLLCSRLSAPHGTRNESENIGQTHADCTDYQQRGVLGLGSAVTYTIAVIGVQIRTAVVVGTAVVVSVVAVFRVISRVTQVGVVFRNDVFALLSGVIGRGHARQTRDPNYYQTHPNCEKSVFQHVSLFEV